MFKVGDKIKFKTEKQRYKVVATDGRWVIAIKPFNVMHTYLYTIIDLQDGIREPEDSLFGRYDLREPEDSLFGRYDLREPNDVAQCLSDLQTGKTGISVRSLMALDLETT